MFTFKFMIWKSDELKKAASTPLKYKCNPLQNHENKHPKVWTDTYGFYEVNKFGWRHLPYSCFIPYK